MHQLCFVAGLKASATSIPNLSAESVFTSIPNLSAESVFIFFKYDVLLLLNIATIALRF